MMVELGPTSCAVCGFSEQSLVLTGYDREGELVGEFSVVCCEQCGHHRTDPAPLPGQEAALYPAGYAPFQRAVTTPRGRVRSSLRRLLRWQQLGTSLPPSAGFAVELGCGSGGFLSELNAAGWSTLGVEPSPAAASVAEARGLSVLVGTDERLDDLAAESADLSVANMVLEHLLDPALALRRLHRLTRVGGQLLVVVPNFASASRRRFGRDWYALQLPRHVQHFDPGSLGTLLEQAGWTVDHVWHQPRTIDTWRSLELRYRHGPLHAIGRLGTRFAFALDLVLLPVLVPIARMRGASRLTVVASKRRP